MSDWISSASSEGKTKYKVVVCEAATSSCTAEGSTASVIHVTEAEVPSVKVVLVAKTNTFCAIKLVEILPVA